MTDKKLIAEALLEIAQNSTTEFLEVSVDNKELINAAKKLGIVLPSPDLAVFKTIYCEIDKVNKNNVILPKKAVQEGLQTLLGKQINWEHDGAGRICGYIIAASIKGNLVEIIGVLFKSLFPEEMQIVKSRFKKKELAVSFEIWNRTEDGSSTVTELTNGTMIIDPIIFHGCGLLLSADPACPKAKVYTLMAQKEINEAEEIVDKVFSKDLIFASLAIKETEKVKEETVLPKENVEKKEEKTVAKEVKIEKTKAPETKPEEAKKAEVKLDVKPEEVKKEVKVEETKVIPEVKAEEKKAEIKKEAKKEEPKVEEKKVLETKPEEAKKAEVKLDVKPEEVKKDKIEEDKAKKAAEEAQERSVVKIVTESTATTTETPKEDGYDVVRKGKNKRTVFYSDKTESVSETDFEVVDKWTRAELDAKIKEAKDEMQKIIDAKDKDLETLKKELEQKPQDLNKAKVEEKPEGTETKLEIGNVTAVIEDPYKEDRDGVDKKAFKR